MAAKVPLIGRWRVTARSERFIAERVVPETVMGFDLVCSAPKSVSLPAAVGDQRRRGDIAEALDAAVDAAVRRQLHISGTARLLRHIGGRNRPADGFQVPSFTIATMSRSSARVAATEPKWSLAVRCNAVDLERHRQRAEADGVGITQLVRG